MMQFVMTESLIHKDCGVADAIQKSNKNKSCPYT